jgi:predicted nucleic acid-binding protein
MDRAWELSRRYDNHPIYDMIYVAVAERAHGTLVTADSNLRQRLANFAWIVAPDI